MRVAERASQIWPVLAWAAHNRQVLTYEILGRLIGVPRQGLAKLLEPIQSYCLRNRLEPLTILVVRQDTGMPGVGFVAAQDISATQARVFAYDWVKHGCPSVDEFERAVSDLPSTGIAPAADVVD